MSLQSAIGAVLLIGLPILVLALGVLAHAYYVARPRSAANTDRMIEDLVTESIDQLLAELRASLRVEAPAPSASDAPAPQRPQHAFSALATPTPAPAAPLPAAASALPPLVAAPNLRMAVAQLMTEGLSDRSIARRLSVGIEEVRAARLHGEWRRAA